MTKVEGKYCLWLFKRLIDEISEFFALGFDKFRYLIFVSSCAPLYHLSEFAPDFGIVFVILLNPSSPDFFPCFLFFANCISHFSTHWQLILL